MHIQCWEKRLLQGCLAALAMASTPCFPASAYSVTAIGSLGGKLTTVFGLNDVGQVSGVSSLPGDERSHAFIYSAGRMTDIGTLGGSYAAGVSINNSGQVSGYSRTSGSGTTPLHAFVYSNGSMSDLGTLSGQESYAFSINSAGQVAGWSDIAIFGSHAFLYENGFMRDLGTLGSTYSSARSINNLGQIVGASTLAGDPISHLFLYSNGMMRDLGTFQGLSTEVQDINDVGQIVGFGYPAEGGLPSNAFLYRDGTMVDLGIGQAIAINNAGQVVGINNDRHAFLYSDGMMQDLNDLIDLQDTGGRNLSMASNINNNGQIVAMAWGPGPFGPSDAFLLTPRSDTPEPPVSLLMLVGLVGLGLLQRHTSHTLTSRDRA